MTLTNYWWLLIWIAVAGGILTWVIASRIRGNTDLIDEGKGGYLVDATDVQGFVKAIQMAISDKEKLSKMEEYNYSKIQDYGEEAVLKEMSALYQSMM